MYTFLDLQVQYTSSIRHTVYNTTILKQRQFVRTQVGNLDMELKLLTTQTSLNGPMQAPLLSLLSIPFPGSKNMYL